MPYSGVSGVMVYSGNPGISSDNARSLTITELNWYVASGNASDAGIAQGELARRLSATAGYTTGFQYTMPAVARGPQGDSGYSGVGASGYSGAPGASGFGTSGYSGVGTSGYSGSGISGVSGVSGSGVSGFSGSGFSGWSGVTGVYTP